MGVKIIDTLLKYFSIPSLIFLAFGLIMIIYLSFILWREHWGQWIFNRIVFKKNREENRGDKEEDD